MKGLLELYAKLLIAAGLLLFVIGLACGAEPRLALRVSAPCDASCDCGCQDGGPCLCGQEASRRVKPKRAARTWNCGDGGPKWTWSDKGKCWRRTVCNASGCSLESCRPGQVPKSMRARPVQVAFGGCSSGG